MIMTVNLQSASNIHGKAMNILHTGLPSLPAHKQIREGVGGERERERERERQRERETEREREIAVKQMREQDPNTQKVQKNAMYWDQNTICQHTTLW